MTAKTPSNPVPYSSGRSAQWSLDPPGRWVDQVEGKGFTWRQGLPTGWVGQRRQKRWSGESSERKKRKSTFIHHLVARRGRADPEMHSHPPLWLGPLIQRYPEMALALPGGLKSRPRSAKTPHGRPRGAPRIFLCKGGMTTDPWGGLCDGRRNRFGIHRGFLKKVLEVDCGSCRVTGHGIWDLQF